MIKRNCELFYKALTMLVMVFFQCTSSINKMRYHMNRDLHQYVDALFLWSIDRLEINGGVKELVIIYKII